MKVDGSKQGQLMGVTGSIFAFAFGIGPLFSGYVFKYGLTMPFIFVGLSFLLAAIIAGGKK
jgi:hypothetical protein